MRRRLRRWRSAAATIPGTAAILSRKRMRYQWTHISVKLSSWKGNASEAHPKPLVLVHEITALAKLFQGHGSGIRWERLVLVAGGDIEAPSAHGFM